jgi:hypothetical protein
MKWWELTSGLAALFLLANIRPVELLLDAWAGQRY